MRFWLWLFSWLKAGMPPPPDTTDGRGAADPDG